MRSRANASLEFTPRKRLGTEPAETGFYDGGPRLIQYSSALSIVQVERCRFPAIVPVRSLGTDVTNQ